MAIQKLSLEISPYTYEVTQLDALKGRKAFVRLTNTLGAAFSHATSAEAAVGNLLAGLKSEELDHFCDLFGEHCTVTGGEYEDRTPQLKGRVFGEHFAGNYLAMFEWLVFCVTANYGSFFAGIDGLVEKYKPKNEPEKSVAKEPLPASP